MMKMFNTLRQENELVVQLKGLCPGHKIPMGLLMAGKESMKDALNSFERAKKMDLMNEKRPE